MNGRILLLFVMLISPLVAAPQREGVAIQEMRLLCDEFAQKLHNQKVELDLLSEKINNVDDALQSLRHDTNRSTVLSGPISTDRLAQIEKRQEALATDIATLKNHFNASSLQIARLEKELSQDIRSLKSSLQSMLALLKGEAASENLYVVKPGDSLGQIALDHKVSLKQLRELNQLSNDKIFVGQKLQLP